MNETFGDWILQQLDLRGWNQAELARRASIGEGTLSRIISGTQRCGPDVSLSIARALGRPPDEIFRLAGLLPPMPPGVEEEHELLLYFRQMDESSRREALAIVKALRETKRSAYETRKP